MTELVAAESLSFVNHATRFRGRLYGRSQVCALLGIFDAIQRFVRPAFDPLPSTIGPPVAQTGSNQKNRMTEFGDELPEVLNKTAAATGAKGETKNWGSGRLHLALNVRLFFVGRTANLGPETDGQLSVTDRQLRTPELTTGMSLF